MPRTVRDLMLDAVKEGYSMLAHSLFVAIQEKIISANDSEINLPFNKFPIDKCTAAHKSNLLGINPTLLFAIPLENDFAMYLSKSEKEAKELHYSFFKKLPSKIFDMTDKIYTDLYDETTKKRESFADIRNRTMKLPAYVCSMPKRR
ncbi:hypothetical protein BK128_21390 [Viridibacillus sp. FSL H7-0596]|uniref:hypothetical protein n=1 Tax=Viridibacillus sp. FSL H7-0596 TaxID=1928923 RepID=UPI00096E74F2|nr:hypothetical protein [Viridibacillus sp. FSL H7-0596]OMC81827.1 hypothetical protein BK128_21390 [Viridibacillus sp. FSL H7-0596]